MTDKNHEYQNDYLHSKIARIQELEKQLSEAVEMVELLINNVAGVKQFILEHNKTKEDADWINKEGTAEQEYWMRSEHWKPKNKKKNKEK